METETEIITLEIPENYTHIGFLKNIRSKNNGSPVLMGPRNGYWFLNNNKNWSHLSPLNHHQIERC